MGFIFHVEVHCWLSMLLYNTFLFIPNQLVRVPQIWNQDDDVGNMQIMRLDQTPTSGEIIMM
jgi:hypothetical protein